jgi:hypothetical protein
VYVVVDSCFGEELALLPQGVPIWIVDTPANQSLAERLWRERPEKSQLEGISIFCVCSDSPEENLLGELATIEPYHGPQSSDPPYRRFEVIGTRLPEKARLALAEYGFVEFHQADRSFEAIRQRPA